MKIGICQLILPCIALLGFTNVYALPNPAAQYCDTLGGKLEFVTTPPNGGTTGLCTFGKASVEEWTLFHFKKGKQTSVALSTFCSSHNSPTSEIANPETLYCKKVAGTPIQAQTSTGGSIKLCQFEDNSTIEQWTLFLGPNFKDNFELNQVLDCN